jgi:hypothetical protein
MKRITICIALTLSVIFQASAQEVNDLERGSSEQNMAQYALELCLTSQAFSSIVEERNPEQYLDYVREICRNQIERLTIAYPRPQGEKKAGDQFVEFAVGIYTATLARHKRMYERRK